MSSTTQTQNASTAGSKDGQPKTRFTQILIVTVLLLIAGIAGYFGNEIVDGVKQQKFINVATQKKGKFVNVHEEPENLKKSSNNNQSSPRKTLDKMLNAANEENIQDFFDCLDISSMAGRPHFEIDEIDEQKAKSYAMNDPEQVKSNKEMMKSFREMSNYKVLNEVDSGDDTKTLSIAFIGRQGVEEVARFVFRNRRGSWKLANFGE